MTPTTMISSSRVNPLDDLRPTIIPHYPFPRRSQRKLDQYLVVYHTEPSPVKAHSVSPLCIACEHGIA